MKKQLKSFAGLFLLILLSSCAADQLEINETSTENSQTVWNYDGDSTTLQKVIAELKNSENRKPLERRLAKNEVLWKEAKFLLIDNKKRIMVPFLSTDKENVIGVLALVKDAKGKTTFDMAVRSRLTTKDNKLPFWNPDIWMGYFMASDKDILGIKNGNPGFKQTIANNKKSKANARIICDFYETVTTHCSYAYTYNAATGEAYNFVDRGCTDTYSYSHDCYWVPDPITEPTTNPGGDGSGGDGSGGGGISVTNNVINQKLDPCTYAVLEKLENSTQSDISKMIERFNPSGSFYNIYMMTGQVTNPNDFAETKKIPNSYSDVIMVFNEDYIKGTGQSSPPTDLSVATTMTHEIIHAYLISLLQDNIICGSSAICDFPTIYDAYVQQQIEKDRTILPDAHHELIAEKYLLAIASTIQEFHTGNPIGSGNPDQFYIDLAWGGLQNTAIFNKTFPDDPNHKNYNRRQQIFGRIYAEKSGIQYGVNTPLGTPCNN